MRPRAAAAIRPPRLAAMLARGWPLWLLGMHARHRDAAPAPVGNGVVAGDALGLGCRCLPGVVAPVPRFAKGRFTAVAARLVTVMTLLAPGILRALRPVALVAPVAAAMLADR